MYKSNNIKPSSFLLSTFYGIETGHKQTTREFSSLHLSNQQGQKCIQREKFNLAKKSLTF